MKDNRNAGAAERGASDFDPINCWVDFARDGVAKRVLADGDTDYCAGQYFVDPALVVGLHMADVVAFDNYCTWVAVVNCSWNGLPISLRIQRMHEAFEVLPQTLRERLPMPE